MSSVLSIITSKRIQELVGEFETEKSWVSQREGGLWDCYSTDAVRQNRMVAKYLDWKHYPAPTFAELIRVLPKFGWQKRPSGYNLLTFYSARLLHEYMNAPTESEGMAATESYLNSLIEVKK